MGLPEVFIEHSKGERHQKFLRVSAKRKLFLIGSSREANLRLTGSEIQGCHAALRYREPHWYICDISGKESLKINGQVMSEAKLDSTASIEIGEHHIQLFAKERSEGFFQAKGASSDAQPAQLALHQVVVRSRGRIVETKILPGSKPFVYRDGESVTIIPAPRSSEWVTQDLRGRQIQQRLVGAQEILESEKLGLDRDLRGPLVMALMLFAFIVSTLLFFGSGAEKRPEVALDQKSLDMIYNAKVLKKKRVESEKVVKTARAKSGGNTEQAASANTKSTAPDESMAPKVDKTSTALTSLRQSGLANLVGKIAKRANKQGVLVAAQGVSADNRVGRAFFSTGTSTTGGGGGAAKEGPTFRLGGVATHGRAGGAGNFKDGTALAGGNVGNGDLVAMVDDETVIEGGLDRDAIAEVIRRNLGQIRYCYERQLSATPELYGKILVKFTIGAAGDVSEPRVDNTTLKSAMVEGCIMRRLASWKFPEPKGGTQVRVSYPFLFKAN